MCRIREEVLKRVGESGRDISADKTRTQQQVRDAEMCTCMRDGRIIAKRNRVWLVFSSPQVVRRENRNVREKWRNHDNRVDGRFRVEREEPGT